MNISSDFKDIYIYIYNKSYRSNIYDILKAFNYLKYNYNFCLIQKIRII